MPAIIIQPGWQGRGGGYMLQAGYCLRTPLPKAKMIGKQATPDFGSNESEFLFLFSSEVSSAELWVLL
jgi:hypothetical protein